MSNRVSLCGILCDSLLKTSAQLHGRRNYVSGTYSDTWSLFFFFFDLMIKNILFEGRKRAAFPLSGAVQQGDRDWGNPREKERELRYWRESRQAGIQPFIVEITHREQFAFCCQRNGQNQTVLRLRTVPLILNIYQRHACRIKMSTLEHVLGSFTFFSKEKLNYILYEHHFQKIGLVMILYILGQHHKDISDCSVVFGFNLALSLMQAHCKCVC